MKNIHILPTDKPSRLAGSEYITNVQGIDKRVFKFKLWNKFIDNKDLKAVGYIPHNIYITNDEEIKQGDWYLINGLSFSKYDGHFTLGIDCKKIILTTDQDLIEGGVQEIDDEFLEWFVKNPSCEEIEVTSEIKAYDDQNRELDYAMEKGDYTKLTYKIIIPKEEPKQYPIGGYAPGFYSCTCVTCKTHFQGDKRAVQCESCAIEMTKEKSKQETLEEEFKFKNRQMGAAGFVGNKIMENMISKFKQETLEEASARLAKIHCDVRVNPNTTEFQIQQLIIKGARWQAEKMYSEEEVLNILQEFKRYLSFGDEISQTEWFEQFKKK